MSWRLAVAGMGGLRGSSFYARFGKTTPGSTRASSLFISTGHLCSLRPCEIKASLEWAKDRVLISRLQAAINFTTN